MRRQRDGAAPVAPPPGPSSRRSSCSSPWPSTSWPWSTTAVWPMPTLCWW
jgi:hypothetical protein